MKKINNSILKKEIKKINKYFYIGIFLVILSSTIAIINFNINNKTKYTYLNDIIENKNNQENVNAYLNVTDKPYSFAKYDDEENYAFYIIFDNRYFYIAYLDNFVYEKLNVENLESNPIKIYGTTTTIPNDVKQIAIEVYNEGLDEENKIDIADFNNYFGGVYLNNVTLLKTNITLYLLSLSLLIISLIIIIIFLIKKHHINVIIKNISKEELEKIESNIDDERTLKYNKQNLILTPNYIISFKNGLKIFKYEDLIWIYENRIKQYRITTIINIFIVNNLGQTINIAKLDVITKKGKNIAKEIIDNISTKNPKMLIGFSKKNQTEIDNILKKNN